MRDYYKVSLTWSSNALEGNSLTEIETKILIEDHLTIGDKSIRETFETIDHAKAYDYMFSLINKNQIIEADIKTLHKLFHHNIDKDYAGVYRDIPAIISGSKYPVSDVESIKKDILNLCKWINNDRLEYHPVEFAAILHKKFIFIHPFKDGNGRVTRLLMNAALIQDGYLPALIPPILRNDYIAFLDKAHIDDKSFVNFIAERELESQKDFLRLLHIPIPKL